MFRKIISIIILISFIFWTSWYVYTNVEDFQAIRQVTWTDILMLTTAFLVILLCNGIFISVVTSAFQIRLKSIEWLSLATASSFANYFLPFKGGAALRALYMLKLHGFPLTEFISTLSVMYLMHVVVNSILALVGMGLITSNNGPVDITVLGFFVLAALFGILAVTGKINISSNYQSFPLVKLHQVLSGWKKVREDRSLVARLWLLMLILALATVWQCKVAFASISIPLSWGGILVYAASKNLAMLISLTPGSIGVVEVISIYLGDVLGYSTSDALLVQGLIRSVAIVVLLTLGPVAFLFLQRHIKMSRQEVQENG